MKIIGPAHKSQLPADGHYTSIDGFVTRIGTSEFGGWYEIECGETVEYRRRSAFVLIHDSVESARIKSLIAKMNESHVVRTEKSIQREKERMRERLRSKRKKEEKLGKAAMALNTKGKAASKKKKKKTNTKQANKSKHTDDTEDDEFDEEENDDDAEEMVTSSVMMSGQPCASVDEEEEDACTASSVGDEDEDDEYISHSKPSQVERTKPKRAVTTKSPLQSSSASVASTITAVSSASTAPQSQSLPSSTKVTPISNKRKMSPVTLDSKQYAVTKKQATNEGAFQDALLALCNVAHPGMTTSTTSSTMIAPSTYSVTSTSMSMSCPTFIDSYSHPSQVHGMLPLASPATQPPQSRRDSVPSLSRASSANLSESGTRSPRQMTHEMHHAPNGGSANAMHASSSSNLSAYSPASTCTTIFTSSPSSQYLDTPTSANRQIMQLVQLDAMHLQQPSLSQNHHHHQQQSQQQQLQLHQQYSFNKSFELSQAQFSQPPQQLSQSNHHQQAMAFHHQHQQQQQFQLQTRQQAQFFQPTPLSQSLASQFSSSPYPPQPALHLQMSGLSHHGSGAFHAYQSVPSAHLSPSATMSPPYYAPSPNHGTSSPSLYSHHHPHQPSQQPTYLYPAMNGFSNTPTPTQPPMTSSTQTTTTTSAVFQPQLAQPLMQPSQQTSNNSSTNTATYYGKPTMSTLQSVYSPSMPIQMSC